MFESAPDGCASPLIIKVVEIVVRSMFYSGGGHLDLFLGPGFSAVLLYLAGYCLIWAAVQRCRLLYRVFILFIFPFSGLEILNCHSEITFPCWRL